MTSELVSIEIPTDDRELSVVLLELDAPWHSVNQIETVLASLERIDLGLVRMSVDLENWSDYDRRVAAKAVWKGVRKETSITLSSADERFWASVSRHDRTPEIGAPVHRNIVTFTLPACEVRVWVQARLVFVGPSSPFRYDTEESVAGMRAFSHWMNDVE
jgi:hypothetical protein